MTLNDLIRKANDLATKFSSGDIELIDGDGNDIDLDLKIVLDYYDGKYYVKVIETISDEQV